MAAAVDEDVYATIATWLEGATITGGHTVRVGPADPTTPHDVSADGVLCDLVFDAVAVDYLQMAQSVVTTGSGNDVTSVVGKLGDVTLTGTLRWVTGSAAKAAEARNAMRVLLWRAAMESETGGVGVDLSLTWNGATVPIRIGWPEPDALPMPADTYEQGRWVSSWRCLVEYPLFVYEDDPTTDLMDILVDFGDGIGPVEVDGWRPGE